MSVVGMGVLMHPAKGHVATLMIPTDPTFLRTLIEVVGRDPADGSLDPAGAWRTARIDMVTSQTGTLYRPVPWSEHTAEDDAERAPNQQVLAEFTDTEALDWLVAFDPEGPDVIGRPTETAAVHVRRHEQGTTIVIQGASELRSGPVRRVEVATALLYHTAPAELPEQLAFVADRAPEAALAALTGPLVPIGPEGALVEALARDVRAELNPAVERAVLERLLQTADERLRPTIFARLGGAGHGRR